MNNMASDISDSGSDSGEEKGEADPVLLADFEDIRKKLHDGSLSRSRQEIMKWFFKIEQKVEKDKSKLKERIKNQSKIINNYQNTIKQFEQSCKDWKTEAEKRRSAEEKLKAEKNQQASTIKNLIKDFDQYKLEMVQVKNNLDCKLKESESKHENLLKKHKADEEKWNNINKTVTEKLTASERAKRDLEAIDKSLRLQVDNLKANIKRIASEKDQLTAEKKEVLLREQKLVEKVTSKDSIIDSFVIEEMDRRMRPSLMNQYLDQSQKRYMDSLRKRNAGDVNLNNTMPDINYSSPQKRSPMSSSEDDTETPEKKRKATLTNPGHVSEEEGEIVNQQPQPQQETTTLALQPVTVPVPVVPAIGPLPQTLPRYIDNGTSVNPNVNRHLQVTPNSITAMNAFRDNRRSGDWNKYGGRGRKY